MCILPLFFCNPAKRIIGVFLVQPVILVENTDSFCLNRWNGTEQIPHYLKMVIHFATAAHDITDLRVVPSVAGTTSDRIAFKEMNIFTRHLCITHEKTSRRECRKSGPDEIGGFMINSFRLFRAGKRLIVTA